MLEIDIGTVIFSIVTFALLALLLRLFLYKPVLAMLDKRRQAVNEALDQAERTRIEAEKADERLQEKLNATRLEADRINRRFGVYPDEKSLHQMYVDIIREAYRVLKPDGILIFKCQDKVSSGKQYLSHVFVINTAVETGFYPKDLFVLLARNRLVADWQTRNQQHSRKWHCYFVVFQKRDTKIKYTEESK